jgi:hypothetical protein
MRRDYDGTARKYVMELGSWNGAPRLRDFDSSVAEVMVITGEEGGRDVACK